MHEGHLFASGSCNGPGMDQAAALAGGPGQITFKIIGSISDMMDTLALPGKKPGHRAFRSQGLQEFEMHSPHPEKGYSHLLGGHFFLPLADQAEDIFIKATGLGNGMHRNTYVINPGQHQVIVLRLGHMLDNLGSLPIFPERAQFRNNGPRLLASLPAGIRLGKSFLGQVAAGRPETTGKLVAITWRGHKNGGSAWESNPPARLFTRHTGFEVREGHQCPFHFHPVENAG